MKFEKQFNVIYKYRENKIPIKLWLSEVDDGAIEQLNHLSILPFAFHHVAGMPDMHKGYGMPIGGVLATKGYIIPNAVGKDIGCFDSETEYLSPIGWKKISEYDGGEVMQWYPDGNGEFVTPFTYIKKPCNEFIHIKTKYGIDQMLSEDHRCLIFKSDSSYKFNKSDVWKAEDIYKNHCETKYGFRHRFLTTFTPLIRTRINLTDEELRVMVMVCADGHIDNNKIVLNLKKKRKIERAKELLLKANISYGYNDRNETTIFRFTPPILKKGIEQFWKANILQLKVIADEVLLWDGDQKNCFYTRKKEEADFINYSFTAIGYRSTISIDERDNGIDYRVFKYNNTKIGINGTPKTEIRKVPSTDGYQYCFTVPSSYLVMRRNGNIFITGNCGMCYIRTSLFSGSLDKSILKKIMSDIRKLIPIGVGGKHKKAQEGMPNENLYSTPYFRNNHVVNIEFENAEKQLGTLGSGNHFIEIQQGDDGFIGIMLHSGSRKLGNDVCDYYNRIAIQKNEKWYSSVPKSWQLAFLPFDDEIGQMYFHEMQYCCDYALANRKLMMDRIKEAFFNHVDATFYNSDFINIHHNFAALENHFGQNIIVHRKGATRAYQGELGIIPGCQGTKSYIVEGRGNPDSFKSCSHGAGRVLGRNDAKRTLSLKDEQEKLDRQGIIHSLRTKKDLEEATGAYKEINDVMDHQKDLVLIRKELTPIAVIKG